MRGSLHLSAETRLRWKVVGQNFGVDTTGRARLNLTRLALLLEDVHEGLAGVVIESLDRIYLDPPYFGSEGDYGKTLFGREQFEVIAEPSAASKATPFVQQRRSADRRCIQPVYLRRSAIDLLRCEWLWP
jgi:hypothetical protein